MKKRVCKATSNRLSINRANLKFQLLWNELGNNISSQRLNEVLKILEPLPILNNKALKIRNRNGVCVETVGKKGKSKYIGVDLCGGVIYFDGNRLGKRKENLVKEMFGFINYGTSSDNLSFRLLNKINTQTI